MALRLCLRAVSSCRHPVIKHAQLSSRSLATSPSSKIVLDLDPEKGVATMKMNKPPVNSLNMEFLQDIVNTIDTVEKEKGFRGLILTSQNPGVFSAGLDILEMYQPNIERLREFWTAVQEMWIRLYGSKLAIMAAINGHSPAGGCLMSLASDYRIMASGKFTIGLNETLLGIVAPSWFMLTMKNTVGHRETERGLGLGHLYSGEEALKVGLIDKLVAPEEVLSTTEAEMAKWLKIPDIARYTSKLAMRRDTLDHLIHRRKEDVDFFVNFITKDSIQKPLGMYLESLKAKAQKK